MKYEHIFFDLDRTLWDYDSNAAAALNSIYNEFTLKEYFHSSEEFFQQFSRQNDLLWEDYRNGLIKKQELRSKRFYLTLKEKGLVSQDLSKSIGERYMYITPRMNTLLPNTISTLNYLKEKGYRIHILTNGFTRTQKRKMENSQITHFFERIFSSEDLGVNKPAKEIFHWAVSSLHAKKKSCLMIGDDLRVDIIGAMNSGLDGVWFNPKNSESSYSPSYIISDLIELQGIL